MRCALSGGAWEEEEEEEEGVGGAPLAGIGSSSSSRASSWQMLRPEGEDIYVAVMQ